jgi:Flp pilus assembly pilin Flp
MWIALWARLRTWLGDVLEMPEDLEPGQGLIEYGFTIILVAIVVLAILYLFGQGLGNIYSNIIRAL